MSRTNKSKTEIAAPSVPERVRRLALFGPPPLIEGEDAAAYRQLLARICAAVKPVDIIDEIFIADVVPSEWEVLRLRRLKWSLIRAGGLEALEDFLGKNLDYELYSEALCGRSCGNYYRAMFQKSRRKMRRRWRASVPTMKRTVSTRSTEFLAGVGMNMDQVLDDAKGRKAKELVQEYVRREPAAVNLVDKLVTNVGKNMDAFIDRSNSPRNSTTSSGSIA